MSIIVNKVGEFYRGLVSSELKRRLSGSSDVFLLSYHKMKAAEMTRLRRNLKEVGGSVLVVKNSFVRKVFQEVEKPAEVTPMIDGPMALVFVKNDPIAVSKALINFVKENEALKLRGGFLAQRVVTPEDIKFISKLSSRQALYQQIASTLNAPIGKLAVSLNQIVAKVAYALKAVSDKKK